MGGGVRVRVRGGCIVGGGRGGVVAGGCAFGEGHFWGWETGLVDEL